MPKNKCCDYFLVWLDCIAFKLILGKHRGFGFIEFEEKDEAAYAIDNMHQSELYGKVLTVNYA